MGSRAGGQGLGKEEVSGKVDLQGCLLWVKQPSSERAQCGVSAGTECVGGAEEQEACVWICGLSLLLWGWGDSSLPPFAFLSRRDAGSRKDAGPWLCHGPWCQPGGCPGLREWVVGAVLQLHLCLGQFGPWGD